MAEHTLSSLVGQKVALKVGVLQDAVFVAQIETVEPTGLWIHLDKTDATIAYPSGGPRRHIAMAPISGNDV
jgi:hypothetical protein